jgi:CheY-like chemotaxis protein
MIKVLVVDNAPDAGAMLSGILADAGCQAKAVQSADEALQALKEDLCHIAIIDMRLEEEDESDESGLKLTKKVRNRFPNVKVIILTGYATVEQALKATREYGAFDYVDKEILNSQEGIQELLTEVEDAYRTFHQFRCFKTDTPGCSYGDIEIKPNQAFVAMPFTTSVGSLEMNDVYKFGIRPALRSAKYKSLRADEVFVGRDILCKICKQIQESPLCIVDVSNWNPNVLLELGMMYGWGKRVVLLKYERADAVIPSDLKGMLYVEYDSIESLKENLKNCVKNLED